MRFQVPQFIEHEAKVIGPFTFKQFIYMGVPGAIAFFMYFLAPFFMFIIATIFLGAIGFAFAFIKIGGRSLTTILLNFFNFTISPKRYIWKKDKTPLQVQKTQYQEPVSSTNKQPVKREIQLTKKSKIKELATRVDTTR